MCPVVCCLYARFVRDDNNGGGAAAAADHAAIGDHRSRTDSLAKDCPENGVEGGSQAHGVARQPRSVRLAADLQNHLAITCFLHMSGHVADEREHVERLPPERDQARVELRDVTELADDGDETLTGLLGLVDHLTLTLGERVAVALEHPKVAADDARRRSKLMNRQ